MPPPALPPSRPDQFSLVASPFQPPLEKTSLETLIEGLSAGNTTSPESLQAAFNTCLSHLEKGSYFAHLACQILQYATTPPASPCILSDDQIGRLRDYYTKNLTYTTTRKGEESFAESMRSAAAYSLSFITACEQEIKAYQTQPFPITQNFADQCQPARELQMVL